MSAKKGSQVAASDRSMDVAAADRSQVFFFPKRNPPVSVRATSREEAERVLAINLEGAPNQHEA